MYFSKTEEKARKSKQNTQHSTAEKDLFNVTFVDVTHADEAFRRMDGYNLS